MDAKVEQPKKKKKKTNPKSPSFSSLPDDIAVNCLARVSKSHYLSLSLVSKSFHSLLSSPELYAVRSQIGTTELCFYLIQQSLPNRWFTQNTIDLKTKVHRIVPPPNSRARLNSTTLVVGYEIYLINVNKQSRAAHVHVLDCRNHTWRRAPNMMVARERWAEVRSIDGKIYVTGGCNSIEQWGEVFDVKTQTWKPLSIPSDDVFNSYHGVGVFGGKLYVMMNSKYYAYDSKEERWEELLLEEGLGTYPMDGPCCVIENVKFTYDDNRKVKWYDSERRKWVMVHGLEVLYKKWSYTFNKIKGFEFSSTNNNIYCEVIRLEKRIGLSGLLEIWGKIERLDYVLTIPNLSSVVVNCIVL